MNPMPLRWILRTAALLPALAGCALAAATDSADPPAGGPAPMPSNTTAEVRIGAVRKDVTPPSAAGANDTSPAQSTTPAPDAEPIDQVLGRILQGRVGSCGEGRMKAAIQDLDRWIMNLNAQGPSTLAPDTASVPTANPTSAPEAAALPPAFATPVLPAPSVPPPPPADPEDATISTSASTSKRSTLDFLNDVVRELAERVRILRDAAPPTPTVHD